MRNGQLCFVDHGDTCIGHPVFDFAMIANTHFIIPSVNPSYAGKFFTVEPRIMLRLWDDVFFLYFSGFSQERQNTVRQGIMAFAVLRQGLSPADKRVFSERVLMENVAATKRKLLPNIGHFSGLCSDVYLCPKPANQPNCLVIVGIVGRNASDKLGFYCTYPEGMYSPNRIREFYGCFMKAVKKLTGKDRV